MAQTQVIERTRQPSAIEGFRDKLQVRRNELVAALKGSGIDVDRFIRTAVTAGQTTPELVTDVSFASLWNELLKASRDQLLPDGRQGVIIPFKGKAKWIPMYRGLLDRFEQSGQYKWVTANLHRDDDIAWDVWVDEQGQHFLHRPGPGRGNVIETYAAALTKSGGFFLSTVNEQDMAHIRSVARARSEDSPWNQWPDQMRLKSAMRRLCKLLPMPQPLEDLMQYEEDDDDRPARPMALQAPRRERPRGAQSALEQFSDEREPVTEPADTGELPIDEPASPETPAAYIETAHHRGTEAKATGAKRTALPGEYREPGREAEVEAWRKGWDGTPLESPGGDDGR